MSSIATFECYGKSWVAEQEFGDSPRHKQIAAGALEKRTPYCRKRLLGPDRDRINPFPEGFKSELSKENIDLSTDFDVLVVQRDTAQDPLEELFLLQRYGKEILLVEGIIVPDSAYLENISMNGANRTYVEDYVTLSDKQDLDFARIVLTTMLLDQHND